MFLLETVPSILACFAHKESYIDFMRWPRFTRNDTKE